MAVPRTTHSWLKPLYDWLDAFLGGNPSLTADMVATSALAANTYANGTLGVGATLTANGNGAISSIDGQTMTAAKTILVTAEVASENNGLYTLTQVGTGGTPYILTRVGGLNQSAEFKDGTTIGVRAGTVNADTTWKYTGADSPIVGTDALTFARDSGVVTTNTTQTISGVKTMTTPTLTTPVIATGMSASGSAANDFSGSTGTFLTSSGANTLSGDTTVAAGKDLLCAAGDTALDFSLGTGVFKSPSGAGTLSGTTDIAANKNLTCSAGTTAVDLSLGTGVFKTTTGLHTFGGPIATGATTWQIADPGDAGAIAVTSSGVCNMTSTGSNQTRTMGIPAFVGQEITLCHDTDGGGDIAVTVASDIGGAGENVATFADVGDALILKGVTMGGTRRWIIVLNRGSVALS